MFFQVDQNADLSALLIGDEPDSGHGFIFVQRAAPEQSLNSGREDIERRRAACYNGDGMDKTIRKYTSLDEMKADEYRYWQSRPVHERVAAVSELTEEGYRMKGMGPDAFRLQRTLVHFERAPR